MPSAATAARARRLLVTMYGLFGVITPGRGGRTGGETAAPVSAAADTLVGNHVR